MGTTGKGKKRKDGEGVDPGAESTQEDVGITKKQKQGEKGKGDTEGVPAKGKDKGKREVPEAASTKQDTESTAIKTLRAKLDAERQAKDAAEVGRDQATDAMTTAVAEANVLRKVVAELKGEVSDLKKKLREQVQVSMTATAAQDAAQRLADAARVRSEQMAARLEESRPPVRVGGAGLGLDWGPGSQVPADPQAETDRPGGGGDEGVEGLRQRLVNVEEQLAAHQVVLDDLRHRQAARGVGEDQVAQLRQEMVRELARIRAETAERGGVGPSGAGLVQEERAAGWPTPLAEDALVVTDVHVGPLILMVHRLLKLLETLVETANVSEDQRAVMRRQYSFIGCPLFFLAEGVIAEDLGVVTGILSWCRSALRSDMLRSDVRTTLEPERPGHPVRWFRETVPQSHRELVRFQAGGTVAGHLSDRSFFQRPVEVWDAVFHHHIREWVYRMETLSRWEGGRQEGEARDAGRDAEGGTGSAEGARGGVGTAEGGVASDAVAGASTAAADAVPAATGAAPVAADAAPAAQTQKEQMEVQAEQQREQAEIQAEQQQEQTEIQSEQQPGETQKQQVTQQQQQAMRQEFQHQQRAGHRRRRDGQRQIPPAGSQRQLSFAGDTAELGAGLAVPDEAIPGGEVSDRWSGAGS